MIQLLRIDDRLIHGQVVIGWASSLDSKEIILYDDIVPLNCWEKDLYLSCTPETLKSHIYDEAQMVTILSDPNCHLEKTIIVVRGPEMIEHLLKAGIDMPIVNVGGMHFKEGRENYLPYLYMSEDEKLSFKRCMQAGVRFECQDVPTGNKVDLADLI